MILLNFVELHNLYKLFFYQLIASSASLTINCLITSMCLIVLYKCDRYQRGGYHGIPVNDSDESEKLLQREQEGEGSGTEGNKAYLFMKR